MGVRIVYLRDETDSYRQDSYDNYAQGVIEKEIEKGNLIINERC